MRAIQLSSDIVSVGELKGQAARLLKRIKTDRRPLVVTQHGKPAAVLLAPEDFDELTERARFIQAVERGLAESERGDFVDDAELDADLEAVFRAADKGKK